MSSSSFSSYSSQDVMTAISLYALINSYPPLMLRVLLLILVLYWWSPVTLAIQLMLLDNKPRKCTDLFSTIATILLLFVIGFVLPILFVGRMIPEWMLSSLWWYFHTVIPLNVLLYLVGITQCDLSSSALNYIRKHWIQYAMIHIALHALEHDHLETAVFAVGLAKFPDGSTPVHHYLDNETRSHHLIYYFKKKNCCCLAREMRVY